jgi:hypothetical protein
LLEPYLIADQIRGHIFINLKVELDRLALKPCKVQLDYVIYKACNAILGLRNVHFPRFHFREVQYVIDDAQQ